MSRELKNQRATLISQARAMLEVADKEDRDLTAEEQTQYNATMGQIDTLKARIDRADQLAALEGQMEEQEPRKNSAPTGFNFNRKTGLGDTELKATAFYVKHGDRGALGRFAAEQITDFMATSNDTDMNVATAADGGVLVPTGHFQGIVAKKNETALYGVLGVTPYNGLKGTTAYVPIETGSANVFVSTAESTGAVDRDAPVLDRAALTIVHMTKSIEITNDLREMEDSAMMAFLENYIGRALAMTHNSALVTEALASGTSVALGAQTAATVGDPETLDGNLAAEYSDNANFVMKKATLTSYRKLISTGPFLYQQTPAGALSPRRLGEFDVYLSSFVPAIGSGLKSSILGDFSYMGMRETPLSFLYDPYSLAGTSRVRLHYRTSMVYKVTNADAILYGKHPTA
jgi:HK97 family phage major capsid protein